MLKEILFKSGVVASRSYVTQRQNPYKIVKFSFILEKETWKSEFREARPSGTYRGQTQNVHKNVKFLSLLMQKGEIWCLRSRKVYAENQNLTGDEKFLLDRTRRSWNQWNDEHRTSESYRYLIRQDKILLSLLALKWLGTNASRTESVA